MSADPKPAPKSPRPQRDRDPEHEAAKEAARARLRSAGAGEAGWDDGGWDPQRETGAAGGAKVRKPRHVREPEPGGVEGETADAGGGEGGEGAKPSRVETITVARADGGQRLDRWFRQHFPTVTQGYLQKLLRTGQIRVNGARAETSHRVESGEQIRVPSIVRQPAKVKPGSVGSAASVSDADRKLIEAMILYEDEAVLVLNKPFGIAVQGGTGTTRHIDGMLAAMSARFGDRPRLVHRLDRDTTGVLLVAKTRDVAAKLGRTFQSRSAAKTYWALVEGVPRPPQGRVEVALVKDTGPDGDRVRKARPGEQEQAMHATTVYSVIDRVGQKCAWVSLKPVTGRQHQLRAHMDILGHPIVGDPKYAPASGRSSLADTGIAERLHLHARRLILPHPLVGRGLPAKIDVTAPLPVHMRQAFEVLGLDADRYEE
ncbi:MAG: RluA family pseudouridine synthase [Hyphomicrobiaceae bacterium]|nr:RluA family pseudouridine synthase [Hyphomicrobiaceae bacterium]